MFNILAQGAKAPGFTLYVTPDQTLPLGEFAGRRVILAFYPADWSPVCGDQMTLYDHVLPEFRRHGAELLGISVNGTPAFFVNGVRYDSPFGVNGLAAAIDRAVLTAA